MQRTVFNFKMMRTFNGFGTHEFTSNWHCWNSKFCEIRWHSAAVAQCLQREPNSSEPVLRIVVGSLSITVPLVALVVRIFFLLLLPCHHCVIVSSLNGCVNWIMLSRLTSMMMPSVVAFSNDDVWCWWLSWVYHVLCCSSDLTTKKDQVLMQHSGLLPLKVERQTQKAEGALRKRKEHPSNLCWNVIAQWTVQIVESTSKHEWKESTCATCASKIGCCLRWSSSTTVDESAFQSTTRDKSLFSLVSSKDKWRQKLQRVTEGNPLG